MSESPSVRKISRLSAFEQSWNALELYYDFETQCRSVMETRSISNAQRSNVKKQMMQLAFSLKQAAQYAKAAKNSDISVAGLMAYYSITSLANAEILWKGDGNVSLDRRGDHFNRHGLKLTAGGTLSEFKAKVDPREGQMEGLFSLWWRFSRHIPPVTKSISRFASGGSTTGYEARMKSYLPQDLMSRHDILNILECAQRLPGLESTLAHQRINTMLCRNTLEETLIFDRNIELERVEISEILHPQRKENIESYISQILCDANRWNEIGIIEFPSGYSIKRSFTLKEGDVVKSFPEYTPYDASSSRSFIDKMYFNEFAYLYISAYIIGMASRYHPHIWMGEIANTSSTSFIIRDLVAEIITRSPLLLLFALDNIIFIYE